MSSKTWQFGEAARARPAVSVPDEGEPWGGGPEPERIGVRWVGDSLVVQRDHQLACFDGRGWELLVDLPRPMAWSLASDQWLVFRDGVGWSFAGSVDDGRLHSVFVWDMARGRWHAGPWPEGLPLLVELGIEPEDQVYEELERGTRLAIDGNDRHPPPLHGHDPWRALHDRLWIDWRERAARVPPGANWVIADLASLRQRLQEELPVWFDPFDAEPSELCSAEARAGAGGELWVLPATDNGDRRAGLVGVGDRPVALLTPSWQGAALHPGRREAAVASRHALLLASLDAPEDVRIHRLPQWARPEPLPPAAQGTLPFGPASEDDDIPF